MGVRAGKGKCGQLGIGYGGGWSCGIGASVYGMQGTPPFLSEPIPYSLCCLEGDVPVASNWLGVCTM